MQCPGQVGVPLGSWGALAQGGAGSPVPHAARRQQRLPAQVHQRLPEKCLLPKGELLSVPQRPSGRAPHPAPHPSTPGPPPPPLSTPTLHPPPGHLCFPQPRATSVSLPQGHLHPPIHSTCRYGGNMSSNLLFFLPRRFFFSSPSAEPGSRLPSAGRSPGAPATTTPVNASRQRSLGLFLWHRKGSGTAPRGAPRSPSPSPGYKRAGGWGREQVPLGPTLLRVPLGAQPLTPHFGQHRRHLLQAGVGLALPHHEATNAW